MKIRNIKENNTWDSNVVPHRSTNQARTCLTSLSGREAVLSCWYGRSHYTRHINSTIQYKHCPPLHTKEYLASRRCRMPIADVENNIDINQIVHSFCLPSARRHQLGDIVYFTLDGVFGLLAPGVWRNPTGGHYRPCFRVYLHSPPSERRYT